MHAMIAILVAVLPQSLGASRVPCNYRSYMLTAATYYMYVNIGQDSCHGHRAVRCGLINLRCKAASRVYSRGSHRILGEVGEGAGVGDEAGAHDLTDESAQVWGHAVHALQQIRMHPDAITQTSGSAQKPTKPDMHI